MMSELPRLLLVDDDPLISESLTFVLKTEFDVNPVFNRDEAKRLLYKLPILPNIALVDLGLPPSTNTPDEGFSLIKELLNFNPNMKILVLSGQDSLDNIRHALTLGAVDFIPKPCADLGLLKSRLKHQLMILSAEQQEIQQVKEKAKPVDLIGESLAMQTLKSQIQQFANLPFSVLVQGESGSGKELVAQSLHTQSDRLHQPCLTVNCAAFTSELLEAQLFGHAKGAFTGAATARVGFFEEASHGTLILDEIGEMPMPLQSKLLRVLENGEYYRLGETKVKKSTARIVASTNRDLLQEVKSGQFRSDLYHRLSVLTIKVPPVAERGEDKLALLAHFQKFYEKMGSRFTLDDKAKELWLQYEFPGNVRELRNIVIRLSAKYNEKTVTREQLANELETEIKIESIPEMVDSSDDVITRQLHKGNFYLDDVLLEWERRYINAALKTSQNNLSQAARILGINRTTLYSKMQRLNKTGN
ncbi:sigma-54-dependent Fis family transcriptional regulator [Thioflexithrix psekupsensis]|uniref:Sigma-54-dependent Fis family transcriptional regulator n=2 Tax=Thioflexithrix psekupsensis TaxID=1570016 RepID=A0A251X7I0_9GAMM|nr:sigma-54-dependent Fis family transcriptional regulator [Thioflexithrix psekupsensis]